MNKRTLITILVVVGLLAIPVTIAFASGQLVSGDDGRYNVLAMTRVSSASDPFTMQVLNGVYQAKLNNEKIDLDLITFQNERMLMPEDLNPAKKYKLIVVSTGNRDEVVRMVCDMEPEALVLTVDSGIPEDQLPKNAINIVFRSEESGYVAGYVAGALTKTGSVGILMGEKDSQPLEKTAAAFEQGLEFGSVETGRTVTPVRQYIGSFYDEGAGYAKAEEMYGHGCDIVFMLAGSSGTGGIYAGMNNNRYAIGVDRDQNDIAPDTVLFSVVKKIDSSVESVIQQCISGKVKGGTEISLGYAEDAVGLVHFINAVPEPVRKRAAAMEEGIKAGLVGVPNLSVMS